MSTKHFDQISLSRWTVSRRIDDLADDIKVTMNKRIAEFESFSIALDESTDATDTAQLAIFVRGVDAKFHCTEEMLALQSMKDTTTGEDVFEEVKTAVEKVGLQWKRLSGISTDGAPAMVGSRSGAVVRIISYISDMDVNTDDVCVFHCILHQQNLCAKSLKFEHVMKKVVTCVNFIKSRALNHRQFQEFLEDVQAEHGDLMFYCEVRWLSKGKMLRRFYDLKDQVSVFMNMKDKPMPELDNPAWMCDLAFLVDVTTHLNELNTKLQTQGQLAHELYGHVRSFQNKLVLWESQLREGNTYHFPTLAKHNGEFEGDSFADELKSLIEQFGTRFRDFRTQELNMKIFSSPFDADVQQAPPHLQMELIEVQEDSDLKAKMKDVSLNHTSQSTSIRDWPLLHEDEWPNSGAHTGANNSSHE